MPNLAFRLILSLGSFYVACLAFFNVLIGSFSFLINATLLTFSALLILQIVGLAWLGHLKAQATKLVGLVELALILAALLSLIIFHELLIPGLASLIISGLTIVLLHFRVASLEK